MSLSVEKLLIPRWKVIAGIPFKISKEMFNVGDIITDNGKQAARDQNGDAVFVCKWEDYPHIFKSLRWDDERAKEDMPEYVRHLNGTCYKIERWKYSTAFQVWFDEDNVSLWSNALNPITKEDYESYINQKQPPNKP